MGGLAPLCGAPAGGPIKKLRPPCTPPGQCESNGTKIVTVASIPAELFALEILLIDARTDVSKHAEIGNNEMGPQGHGATSHLLRSQVQYLYESYVTHRNAKTCRDIEFVRAYISKNSPHKRGFSASHERKPRVFLGGFQR